MVNMLRITLEPRRIRLSVWSVVTIFLVLSLLLQTVMGSAYYSLMMQAYSTVGSPPVILEEGTVGTSTIYTNKTSAKVSVEAPLLDYVDSNNSDVDSSADKGQHSNFAAQQAGPDSISDTLAEENTGEITKVGTDTSGTGNILTLSFSHTLVSGTNRIVIISIGIENGDTIDVSNVTYGGTTMTLAVERITGTSGFRYLSEIWYILENDLPSDGSQTIEVNCSGTANALEVNSFCSEYTGVAQGAPEATNGAAQLSGNTISNTISPSDDAWVISIAGSGNAGSFTHGQEQVEVLDFQDASSTFAVAELRGASGETSLSSTYSSTVNRLCRVAASWIKQPRYELDLEMQWTNIDYTRTNEELCIRTGTFSGSENIQVRVWNNAGSSWHWVMNLTASQWNNASITSYLTSYTFTVQFLGGMETSDSIEDIWNIDATLLHVWSGWLSGWNKRFRMTIDRDDVDTALSNFPILVHLSNSSSGRNNDDVSSIFDELQNDANRKKIAVTESDGLTQCYVEIERWDDAREEAWLWVRTPSINNTTDTVLYLYYDMDQADNTVYVGDTGSTAAQNVWHSSFKGVWHLSETSGGVGAIKDSTSNNNVGTDNGSPTFSATGLIDSAISFDGIDDYINMSNSASLQFTSSLTIEAWINLDSFGSGSDVDIVLRKGEGNPNDYQLAIHDQKLALMIEENDDAGLESSTSLTATTWYYLAGTWNGSIRRVYLNGSEDGSGSKVGGIIPDSRDIYIGGRAGTDLSTGVVDEIRASNMTRSAAWVKASYESGRDDLLDFGSEQTSTQNFDYVLRVNNTVTNSWQIRLKKYSDSNISRLQNCTLYFHNSTDGTSNQILIENGSYNQSEGSWFTLSSLQTVYIAMKVESNSSGTSYIFIFLEILVPNTTTYFQCLITFQIT